MGAGRVPQDPARNGPMEVTPYTLHHGDCLEVLRTLPDASVDAVVTDPPYGLSFMGKRWDYDVPSTDVWTECLRVLKPGGHLLAFAGTRTQHRMAVRIEDAGFDIRNLIAWVYGSGFPKSLDVSKAIDRKEGAEREVVGLKDNKGRAAGHIACKGLNIDPAGDPITTPATPAARAWQGWGTALKPALEPITVARKPLDGTVAENVLAHGTGALNVDGCRVGTESKRPKIISDRRDGNGVYRDGLQGSRSEGTTQLGRWPANLIHDGSEEVVGLFPETGPAKAAARGGTNPNPMDWGNGRIDGEQVKGHDDAGGSASRFFYCAKASKADRDAGCEGLEAVKYSMSGHDSEKDGEMGLNRSIERRNHHPTVKPTDLMRYLCRLVTPPGGVVLDPFMGSGSTGRGAILEGFRFIGIEREADYLTIARARIDDAVAMRSRETAQGSLGL